MIRARPNRSVSTPNSVPPMPHATSLIATIRPPVPTMALRSFVCRSSAMLGVRMRLKTLSAMESNIHARNAEARTSHR
jgi:hypothetical protein